MAVTFNFKDVTAVVFIKYNIILKIVHKFYIYMVYNRFRKIPKEEFIWLTKESLLLMTIPISVNF